MHEFGVVVSPSLIGRTRELGLLEQAMAAVQGGQGQAVILSGEAGIGKSRLVAETSARAAREGFAVFRGLCFEQDRTFPYAPWIDGLRGVLARRDAADVRQLLADLMPEFSRLLPELDRGPGEAPSRPPLEPEAEKRRLFEAVGQVLARLAGDHPLLLVLEDLHWSDDSSLELLSFLTRRIGDRAVLVVVTYRPEEVSPSLAHFLAEFERRRAGREITLTPLTREETTALVQAIFDIRMPIKADFLDLIVPLTDGNPFFIEEVLKSLVEAGEIYHAEGRWERRPASELHVPRSVREAVERRAARLSADARRLLTLAAVVGQRSAFALLQALTAREEPALLAQVRELIAAQLMVEASADELVFRHALTREAVYATLLARERRDLHRQVMLALQQQYASSQDAHAADLAYHAFAAEEWASAFGYAQRAAERAQALYATRESAVHYARALDAAQKLGVAPSPALLRGLAQIHETLGDLHAAHGEFEQALARARAEGDRSAEWQALLDLGFLWTARDYERSGEYLRQALALARELESPASVAKSLNRLGNWHFNRMRLAAALACYQEALGIFRSLPDRSGIAETLDLLGSAQMNYGDMIASRTYLHEAAALFRASGDRRRLAQCLLMLPLLFRFNTEILGPVDPAEPLAAAEEGLLIARAIGWRPGELQASGRLWQYYVEAGDYGLALSHGQAGLAMAEDIGHVGFRSAGHWGLGHLYLLLFAPDLAEPHIAEAARLAQESGSGLFHHHAQMALAQLCMMRGDWKGAETALGPAAGLPDGWLPTALRENWCVRAEMLLARRDAAGALDIADRLIAHTLHVEEFGPRAVPRLSLLRGQALFALGRMAEAEDELQAAWDVARAQGKRPLMWRIAASRGRAARALGRRKESEQAFAAAAQLVSELAGGLPDEQLRAAFERGAYAGLPRPRPPTPRRAVQQQFGGLTARELEVAGLIAEGLSNRQIAAELVIAERTADRHVANIMSRLGYNSRAQIAAWAAEKGLRVRPGLAR